MSSKVDSKEFSNQIKESVGMVDKEVQVDFSITYHLWLKAKFHALRLKTFLARTGGNKAKESKKKKKKREKLELERREKEEKEKETEIFLEKMESTEQKTNGDGKGVGYSVVGSLVSSIPPPPPMPAAKKATEVAVRKEKVKAIYVPHYTDEIKQGKAVLRAVETQVKPVNAHNDLLDELKNGQHRLKKVEFVEKTKVLDGILAAVLNRRNAIAPEQPGQPQQPESNHNQFQNHNLIQETAGRQVDSDEWD